MEAVGVLPGTRPDAIIQDINIPRLDGFGVLKSLKASQALALAPVMMLSARNARGDVKTAMTLGANDFLTKPFRDDLRPMRLPRLLRSRGVLPKPAADGHS